jgi:transposase
VNPDRQADIARVATLIGHRAKGGGGRKPKIDRARLALDRARLCQGLAELVRADSDATLAELHARLGVQCALSAIWEAFDQLRITFQKTTAAKRA